MQEQLPEKLTSEAVANHLEISRSKLKFWVNQLGLTPEQDARGGWRFSQTDVALLEKVRTLREIDDRSMDTVRRVVVPLLGSPASAQQLPEQSPPVAQEGPREVPGNLVDTKEIVAALERIAEATEPPSPEALAIAIESRLAPALTAATEAARKAAADRDALSATVIAYQDMADKYAKACHHIGQQDQTIQHLAAQLEQQKALPAPKSELPGWKRAIAKALGL